MSDWRHCIVSYIDLVGIKDMFPSQKPAAIAAIRQLTRTVHQAAQTDLNHHTHAYSWNDSVLLLAYCDEPISSFEMIIREVDDLKKQIDDAVGDRSYAIAVNGMAIPETIPSVGDASDMMTSTQPRHVYIMASSMAFANCFKIEEKLGRKYKKKNIVWYLDERIARKLNIRQATERASIPMLPDNGKRFVFMYDDYLYGPNANQPIGTA